MKKILCGQGLGLKHREESKESFNERHARARIVVSDRTCVYDGGTSNARGSRLTGEYQSDHSATVLALVIAYKCDPLHLVRSSGYQPLGQAAQ